MKFTFFNKQPHRTFDLPPRYYDAEKSDFERRMRKWERIQKEEEKGYNSEDFKAELKMRWQANRESDSFFNRQYTNRKRMMVLVVIVFILVFVMYFIGKKYAI